VPAKWRIESERRIEAKGLQYYEARHREQQVHLLKKRAAKLGLQIVEPDAA